MTGPQVHHIGNGGSYTGLFFYPIEEWSQFFTPCNWRTFHPVYVELEDDRMMGGVEVTAIVLGLGFRVRWNYARTEKVDHINAMVEGIKAGTVETFPWPHTEPGVAAAPNRERSE